MYWNPYIISRLIHFFDYPFGSENHQCIKDVSLKAIFSFSFLFFQTEMLKWLNNIQSKKENGRRMKMRRKNANIQSMINGKIQLACQTHEKCVIDSSHRSFYLHSMNSIHRIPYTFFHLIRRLARINNISIFFEFNTNKMFAFATWPSIARFKGKPSSIQMIHILTAVYLSYDDSPAKSTFRNSHAKLRMRKSPNKINSILF